jgi:hypothetical protein
MADTSPFPGEETLVASWHALARVYPGAYVRQRRHTLTAVFPSRSAFNNAILRVPEGVGMASEAAAELAVAYGGTAEPAPWALWNRSSLVSLEPPGPESGIRGVVRRGRVAVMTRTLTPGPASDSSLVSTSVRTALSPQPHAPDEPSDADGIPGLDGWVLFRRGAAVVRGWTFVHGTDCGLYGVAALPGSGSQRATMAFVRTVLARLERRGARTASLQSAPGQVSLFASLGFRSRARYEQWAPLGSSVHEAPP